MAAAGGKLRYRIEARSVSYVVPARTARTKLCFPCHGAALPVLKNVSCVAAPGELLAIAGPSGAGKTTLLSVLAGEINLRDVTKGEVLVNGRPMDAALFRRVSGYVEQDDVLFPLLSVEESLFYCARLRLRSSPTEAAARVEELTRELGLGHVAGLQVRCLSGGERRRVSIALNLVHDPAVLLLDEPTTGLDSTSALHVITLLKSMAVDRTKTVVLTIHQPGFRIVGLIDRVLLLSDGAVIHDGTIAKLQRMLADSGHTIPSHVNVLEFAMTAAPSLPPSAADIAPSPPPPSASEIKIHYANSPLTEVRVLTERFGKTIIRDHHLFPARMIQSAVIGLSLGTVFTSVDTNIRTGVGFFAFTLTYLLAACTAEGLPVYLRSRRALDRETSRGAYRLSSYIISDLVVFAPFLLAAALLFAVPVYWMAGVGRDLDGFLYFGLTVWLTALMGNSVVACFSAVADDFVTANTVISGILGSFFLFSGYFVAKERIPEYWKFMHYLSLFKYPFEALVVSEYGGERGRKVCLRRVKGVGCVMDAGEAVRRQGMGDERRRWRNVAVMVGFVVGYRVLCFALLWLRSRRRRR